MRASAPKRCSYPPELDANARGLTVAVSNSASEADPEGDPNSIAAGQRLESGAAYRNRTDDLLITSETL